MIIVIAGLPRSIGAAEYDTISLIEKHLRRTTGVAIGIVRQALVDHANIADPRSNICQPRRRLRLRLVVEPGRKIPGNRCGVLRLAQRVSGLVEIGVRRERRLANQLRRRDLQELGLDPAMEIWDVLENRLVGLIDGAHSGEQREALLRLL